MNRLPQAVTKDLIEAVAQLDEHLKDIERLLNERNSGNQVLTVSQKSRLKRVSAELSKL